MSDLAERTLFYGYRNTDPVVEDVATRSAARSELCACGGWIRVEYESPPTIREAVQAHQQRVGHRLWRANVEALASRSAQPTAEKGHPSRDLSAMPGDLPSAAQSGVSVREVERPFGYNGPVGFSDTITDTMCDARSVAEPSRAGVSRLEGSAP